MIDEKKLIKELEKIFETDEQNIDCTLSDFAYHVFDCIENQPKVGEWIPCSERLPKELECNGHIDPSEYVLVYIYYCQNCVNNGCQVSRYWKSSKLHENPWIDLQCKEENVVAWKPLPEPYKIG